MVPELQRGNTFLSPLVVVIKVIYNLYALLSSQFQKKFLAAKLSELRGTPEHRVSSEYS